MPTRRDFRYTVAELKKRTNKYFAECEASGRKPVPAGLCATLNLPFKRFTALMAIADELAANPTTSKDVKDKYEGEGIQWEHTQALQKEMLRIQADIERRTDTMALFQLKQPWLGGYTDKTATADTGITVNVKLDGIGKGKAFD